MAIGTRLPRSNQVVLNRIIVQEPSLAPDGAECGFLVFLFFSVAGLILFSASSSFAQSVVNPDSTLAAVKNLYDSGSYISAELQARRVLEDRQVGDTLRLQLEKYLAFTLVAQGRNDAAREHFISALKLDSSLTLDPVLTSPKILAVFDAARQDFQSEIAKERETGTVKKESFVGSAGGPTFRAILFPGWEQIHQGKSTKGYILLAAGAVTAITAISSDLLRMKARTDYLNASTPSLAESRYNTYDLYYKTEVYSISAFVLIYIYSELDAFLDLPPKLDAAYSPATRSMSLGLKLDF